MWQKKAGYVIYNNNCEPTPTKKILRIIKTSSHFPVNWANSAMARAMPPADNVPRKRLKPLLRVAPEKAEQWVWAKKKE